MIFYKPNYHWYHNLIYFLVIATLLVFIILNKGIKLVDIEAFIVIFFIIIGFLYSFTFNHNNRGRFAYSKGLLELLVVVTLAQLPGYLIYFFSLDGSYKADTFAYTLIKWTILVIAFISFGSYSIGYIIKKHRFVRK